MYVPNYVPEPIEVPGNVTTNPYRLRLLFIRRVAGLHFLSMLVVTSLSLLPFQFDTVQAVVVWLLVLVLLDLLRIRFRGEVAEAVISSRLLPFLLLASSLVIHNGESAGLPLWSMLVGPTCGTLYAFAAGRDFSFVGCFFISWVISTVMIAAITILIGVHAATAWLAEITNGAFLLYWTYDLASLLSRRRQGEEFAAVVDLYRDVLNIFGYLVRILRHWKKHHIWNN